MKLKNTLKFIAILAILVSFSCEDDLKDCVTTICDGPEGTDCRDVPNYDSSCYPAPDNGVLEFE